MSGIRFILEWGIGGVFGLPVAFTFGAIGDDASSCFGVHLAPIYVILSWRPA